jgi:hypothetical protein
MRATKMFRSWLAITTVRVRGSAIGEEAARLVLQRGNGEALVRHVIDLGFKSCAEWRLDGALQRSGPTQAAS